MSIILLLILLLTPLLLLLSKILTKPTNHKLPPSPPSLPFIGHLHLLNPQSTHRSLLSLSANLGRPSGLIFLQLPSPTVVVTSASAAESVLKGHDVEFASRPASLSAGLVGRNVSFSPYSDYWRQTKKLTVVHLLSQKRVFSNPFIASREEEVHAMMTRIATIKREVNLSECFYAYANGVVSRAVAGKGSDAQRFRELMGDMQVMLGEGSTARLVAEVFPTIGKLWGNFLGLNEKYKQYDKRWNEFVAEIVEDHREKMVTGEEKEEDFIDVLLRVKCDGTTGFDITESDIVAIIREMTAAATDTTYITLEWAMSELIKNPYIKAKIQTEIRQITNNKTMVVEDDLSQMVYLRAIIKETLRLHAPAPLLLPHESTTTVSIHGYEIPPKTKLIINAWAIGRDPQAWDQPEEFKPERFINSDVDFRGNDYQFIP